MATVWETKWGMRRVRDDPPTLAEALAAAQGLTDDPQDQIILAAELMGVTEAEAKAELARIAPDRRTVRLVSAPTREGTVRTVVVERKASRRLIARDTARPNGR